MISNNSMKMFLTLPLVSALTLGLTTLSIPKAYAQTTLTSKQHTRTIQRSFFGCKIGETNQTQFLQSMKTYSDIQVKKQDNLTLPLKARYYVYGLPFAGVPTRSIIFTFYEDVLVSVVMRYYETSDSELFFHLSLLPEYKRRYKGLAVDLSTALSQEEQALTHALYYDGTTALLIGTEYYIRYFNLKLFNKMRAYSTSEL